MLFYTPLRPTIILGTFDYSRSMHLKRLYLPNNETAVFVTLFGANRDPRVRDMHERVMVGHFGLPVTYIQCPFETGVNHGQCMDALLSNVVDAPDAPTYIWWWDNDALLLRREALDNALDTVRNKQTLWGQAWNSSHVKGPNGTTQHPYASQACLLLSTDLYRAIGRPSCDWSPRGDTAEEITYRCEELGYTVALQYPSYSETKTTALSQSCWYGRGNIYGPGGQTYHESRADLEGHVERFLAMGERVLRGEYD